MNLGMTSFHCGIVLSKKNVREKAMKTGHYSVSFIKCVLITATGSYLSGITIMILVILISFKFILDILDIFMYFSRISVGYN